MVSKEEERLVGIQLDEKGYFVTTDLGELSFTFIFMSASCLIF